jgi:hypothetical protein
MGAVRERRPTVVSSNGFGFGSWGVRLTRALFLSRRSRQQGRVFGALRSKPDTRSDLRPLSDGLAVRERSAYPSRSGRTRWAACSGARRVRSQHRPSRSIARQGRRWQSTATLAPGIHRFDSQSGPMRFGFGSRCASAERRRHLSILRSPRTSLSGLARVQAGRPSGIVITESEATRDQS